MDNPHFKQQMKLLERIRDNVDKMNQVLTDVNDKLQGINDFNNDLVMFWQIWSKYEQNANFHLSIHQQQSNRDRSREIS
ncbi:hypothetical protein H4R33_003719 [Dimargaris cristalligena]|uniref:DASH complex subunit DAD4 n=1 Tax=Dimargaris cristalligena TaxID=215637 RepID=A0A4P9ZW34_9FUNG|nr:hypothetical protein H4R33_003719 [Dimargaris cristalligena]RKP37856.1 DASH complex subunit Dad4 [Dimargaris cristalligena]|eukprot:RKP37856.1 DASH complex subunit Dad4 [Dimargaris cristalligena]